MPARIYGVELKPDQSHIKNTENSSQLTEGVDYYFDKGFMVLTSHYLNQRGYCCQNDCRHCPYGPGPQKKLKEKEIESP